MSRSKLIFTVVCLISFFIGLLCSDHKYQTYIICSASVILWIVLMVVKPLKQSSWAKTVISAFMIVSILYALWNIVAIIAAPKELSGYVLLITAILGIILMCMCNNKLRK